MRIAVLLSGRGSNMVNLVRHAQKKHIPATIEMVLSDQSDAEGLRKASDLGVMALYVDPARFSSREEYDMEVVSVLKEYGVELVCLCGYMRIVSPFFITTFKNRVLNIHPSLLPSFPGLDAQKQALEYGVKVAGATVHIVDEGVDTGPVILQGCVDVAQGESVSSLSEKILAVEHRIYPAAVKAFVEGRVTLSGRNVLLDDGSYHALP